MNRTEHLLTILAEECAEVSQRVSKALRFGLDEVYRDNGADNARMISYEMADLMGAYQVLKNEGLLPAVDENEFAQKQLKIERFLDRSRRQGTLSE